VSAFVVICHINNLKRYYIVKMEQEQHTQLLTIRNQNNALNLFRSLFVLLYLLLLTIVLSVLLLLTIVLSVLLLLTIVLSVLLLLTIVLSVLLRYTDSDYPFGIFKLFSK
jgi:hypothetical protein